LRSPAVWVGAGVRPLFADSLSRTRREHKPVVGHGSE
jgi:hypothetical protein